MEILEDFQCSEDFYGFFKFGRFHFFCWEEVPVTNVLDCDIIVSKFELQLCYYVHFQTNTLEKGMNLR